MTLAEARMFVRNNKLFIEIFGEEIFERALANYEVQDFSTFEYVVRDSGQDRCYADAGYPVLCDRTIWHFEEYHNGWKRDVSKPAREYRVPCSYQLREKDLIRDCILLVNPNMTNYTMSIYHLDTPSEIYVKCDDGKSLYVPVRAIVEKDFSIVVRRHITYHTGFYNNKEMKEHLGSALATLETDTAKALCRTIEEGAPYECEKPEEFRSRRVQVSFEVMLDGTDDAIRGKVERGLKYSVFNNPVNVEILYPQ